MIEDLKFYSLHFCYKQSLLADSQQQEVHVYKFSRKKKKKSSIPVLCNAVVRLSSRGSPQPRAA